MKYAFKFIVLLTSLIIIGTACSQNNQEKIASSSTDLFPLTQEQARDESTLNERIVSDTIVESSTHPGRMVRWVEVQFFSHEWKDGPWKSGIIVAMPPEITPDRQGLAAMCMVSSMAMHEDLNMKRDYFEYTAMEFGIPVATIPYMEEHYGFSEIHEMTDHLIEKFIETGDLSWIGNYPGSAVRSRAITMIGKLTGHPITSVVHMGSSISAHQAWVWSLYDDRVKGLVPTGDVGFNKDRFPFDGSLRFPQRKAVEALVNGDTLLLNLYLPENDPYYFGDRLKASILQIVGSNDPWCPPSTTPKFHAALQTPVYHTIVPNYGHGAGTVQHAVSFQMFIDHVLFSRPIGKAELEKVSFNRQEVTCTARLTGGGEIKEVHLYYATSNDPNFLRSSSFNDTPKNNYIKAEWLSVPMTRHEDHWTAEINTEDPSDQFIACFVDVKDEYEDRPGHYSSYVSWTKNNNLR